MKSKSKKNPRSLARLQAFDESGTVVEDLELPLSKYYDELHEIIDSKAFRADRGIRSVIGTLYDSDGTLVEEFENRYDPTGELTRSSSRFGDGTIQE